MQMQNMRISIDENTDMMRDNGKIEINKVLFVYTLSRY